MEGDNRMKLETLDLQILLQYSHKHGYLDVRAGFVGKEFEGAVDKVIRRGNTTVGLRKDGHPVYMRIRGAEKMGGVFAEAASLAASRSREQDSPSLKTRMGTECLSLMRELVNAHNKKRLAEELSPQNVRFEYQAALSQ
jgi:hypothetical protein